MPVQDIDRPDTYGEAPKMQAIRDQIAEATEGLVPVLRVSTDDNFCSSVMIAGTFDPKEDWTNRIFQNGLYFQMRVCAPGRYYKEGDKLTLEFFSMSHKLPKETRNYTRKYSHTDPARIAARIVSFLQETKKALTE